MMHHRESRVSECITDELGVNAPPRAADASGEAEGALDPGRVDAGRALLIGVSGGLGLENNTEIADDRLASPRDASTIAASRLSDTSRSSAMRRRRRQKASSIEMLVRWPAMTSERLTTRALVRQSASGRVSRRASRLASASARSLSIRRFSAFDRPKTMRF